MFDLFGTLVEGWSEATARLRSEQIAAALEVPAAAFLGVLETSYTERADGSLGPPREMLAKLCARIGEEPAPAALSRGAELRVQQFREVLTTPAPSTRELLLGLRRQGIRLGLISDCSAETPMVWPELEWARPIEAALFSWVEGMRKPDQRLYRRVARLLDLRPAECLYVGDGGSYELSGAETAGMRAVRLSRTRVDGGKSLQFDPDPTWRGQQIGDLDEVWELIRS